MDRDSNISKYVEFLLKEGFKSHRYVKEYYVLFQGIKLYFDFYLPELRVLIEVQGEQHYKFNKFFHKNEASFLDQKYRDSLKNQWANTNNFKLLQFSYKEIPKLSVKSFRQKIIDIL